MAFQRIDTISAGNVSVARPIIARFRALYGTTIRLYRAYVSQQSLYRSRRILNSLPENIQQDIGWPNINDRFAKRQR
ncbi:hypothetical protein AAIB41_05630 [Brucella sp. BE17]|uniref:hypothetical protein n=1 Tax=Brucella sp. BE17 TaxID=3142977 RepID=UPI0031BB0D6C